MYGCLILCDRCQILHEVRLDDYSEWLIWHFFHLRPEDHLYGGPKGAPILAKEKYQVV